MSKEAALTMLQAIPVPSTEIKQPPTNGGSPGLQVAEPIKQELDSTRFNHLAKKEAELQRQREVFKKEQEQLQADRQKLTPLQEKLQKFEEMKAKDPIQALKIAGFSETDLFNFIAAQEDTSTPEEKAQKAAATEIQKFKDEQAKIASEAQEKRNTEVLSQFKENISKTLSSDKEKYEYCNHNGPLAEDLIYETVYAVLESDKELISVQEAADMVEAYYEEQDKAMNTLKKRQPRQETQAPEAALKPEVSPRPASKTLSSRTTATVASTQVPKNETKQQKRERLIKALGSLGKQ